MNKDSRSIAIGISIIAAVIIAMLTYDVKSVLAVYEINIDSFYIVLLGLVTAIASFVLQIIRYNKRD